MTVNLFINPYTDSRPERQKELTYSQRINAANEYITMIYELPGRATYRDFFDKINTVSGPRDINIIANLDIFFDETLKLAEALRPHEVFALSRWDVTSENPFNIKRYEEPGSQDVWMFRGPITRQIKYCDFPIGRMGCDNRIAHEFQQAGYLVLNPSKSIRCIHYHVSEQRNYDRAVRNADTVVPPPYAFVKSIFLPIYA